MIDLYKMTVNEFRDLYNDEENETSERLLRGLVKVIKEVENRSVYYGFLMVLIGKQSPGRRFCEISLMEKLTTNIHSMKNNFIQNGNKIWNFKDEVGFCNILFGDRINAKDDRKMSDDMEAFIKKEVSIDNTIEDCYRDLLLRIENSIYSSVENRQNLIAKIIKCYDEMNISGEYLEAKETNLSSPDKISTEKWVELLQNEDVFGKNDLLYLHKMYELGGEATATHLAGALGKHHSSFNAPVVNLAKRVIDVTGIQVPVKDEGTDCYWYVLFNGEYEENNHFIWRLKPNLKEAIGIIHEYTAEELESYSKVDFLEEVFIDENQYNKITSLLRYKKNIILQGPPGVGKTFVSKRLAYSLIGVKDSSRIEMVQFHQNYAYEDFVMGFRPDKHGFSLQYGVFFDFCQRALENPDEDYYFIIDEINRGNLSKVFGELFMLIERDKRDEYVTMGYSKKKFTVPSNVYLIGTMNTADRSLAQLEVAIRRRFAFITLQPAFNEKWYKAVQETGVSQGMMQRITNTVTKINDEIVNDFQLGAGYAIGHSFFAGKPEEMDEEAWYQGVLMFEIQPLLEEYFFDRPDIVTSLVEGL